jgi:hypothetical protein
VPAGPRHTNGFPISRIIPSRRITELSGMPKGLKLVTVTLTQPLLGLPLTNVGYTLVNQI